MLRLMNGVRGVEGASVERGDGIVGLWPKREVEGVFGPREPALDAEDRGRSGGGGVKIDHPKSAVRMAVTHGSAISSGANIED